MLPSHTCFLKCLTSVPHLAVANSEPLVAGQFLQAHRAARADLVGADTDLGAHAELAAIGEAGRGVPIDGGGIHLAEELRSDWLLIDETAGRDEARRRGLQTIGTLGILRNAHVLGLLDLRDSLAKLKESGFHMSEALLQTILDSIL